MKNKISKLFTIFLHMVPRLVKKSLCHCFTPIIRIILTSFCTNPPVSYIIAQLLRLSKYLKSYSYLRKILSENLQANLYKQELRIAWFHDLMDLPEKQFPLNNYWLRQTEAFSAKDHSRSQTKKKLTNTIQQYASAISTGYYLITLTALFFSPSISMTKPSTRDFIKVPSYIFRKRYLVLTQTYTAKQPYLQKIN